MKQRVSTFRQQTVSTKNNMLIMSHASCLLTVDIDKAVRQCGSECVASACSAQHWHNHIRGICVVFHAYDDNGRVAPIRRML